MNIPKLSKPSVFISIIIGVVIGAIITSLTYEFFMRYTLRIPFQNPIVPREKSPIVAVPLYVAYKEPIGPQKPVNKDIKPITGRGEIVMGSKYPEFIDHIWYRESGRGTATKGLNTYCESKGMSNEFGFYPQGKHCFSYFTASVRRLEKWYEDNAGLSDNEKLCKYNTGVTTSECAYLGDNFQAMN